MDREYLDALEAGDEATVADLSQRLGLRRTFDPVGCWPSDRLGELIERRPDLLPELIRRRPAEVTQA